VIDGKVNGAFWHDATHLKPFKLIGQQMVMNKKAPSTQAMVTYNKHALYIAVRCSEPEMSKLHSVGNRRDDPVWKGDDIEIFISTGKKAIPYRHFAVNPHGVKCDAAINGKSKQNIGWNGKWSASTTIEKNAWTVEVTIPWATIGGKPKSGATRRINICRKRTPVGQL